MRLGSVVPDIYLYFLYCLYVVRVIIVILLNVPLSELYLRITEQSMILKSSINENEI